MNNLEQRDDSTLSKMLLNRNQGMVIGGTISRRLLALEEIYTGVEITKDEFFIYVKDVTILVPNYINNFPIRLKKLLIESAFSLLELESKSFLTDDIIHEILEWMGCELYNYEYELYKDTITPMFLEGITRVVRRRIYNYLNYPIEFIGWRGDLSSNRMVAEFLIIQDGIFLPN